MGFENQRNEMSREELSKAIVALIRSDQQLRMAIINLILACPYIVRQY